jgi:ketosteroid isomerase-like protein
MRVLAAVVFGLAAGPALAERPPTLHGPHATATAILKHELAFAARSEQAGAATAFRENMDPVDGLEFGSGAPIRGAAAIADGLAKQGGGTLKWQPLEVFASTGDMGVVWGVWQDTLKPGMTLHGRYVTVWRRDPKLGWKALVDIGNPDP